MDMSHFVRDCGSSVGRVRNSWRDGPGFDSRYGRPLPTGWVGVSIKYKVTGRDRGHGLPALSRVRQHISCQTSVLGSARNIA